MDRRKEERVITVLAVSLEPLARGVTQNVSASGMYVETNASFNVGEPVDFKVEFDAPGGRMNLRCRGEVIRRGQPVEPPGVAIRIAEAIMGMIRCDHFPVIHQ